MTRGMGGLVLLVLAGLVGCGTDPVPLKVEVLLATQPDPKAPAARTTDGTLRGVPPLSELHIGFDRPLSLAKLGGPERGSESEHVRWVFGLVDIVWEGGPAGSDHIAVQAIYSEAGPRYTGNEGGPTVTLPTIGYLPSSARLRLILDRQRLFSTDGAPLDGPTELFVETAPFTVHLEKEVIQVIDPVLLVFSNKGAPDLSDHITVTMGGERQQVVVTQANTRRNEFMALMSPGWPAPGRYVVTVDGGAADNLGVRLAAPVTLYFDVR